MRHRSLYSTRRVQILHLSRARLVGNRTLTRNNHEITTLWAAFFDQERNCRDKNVLMQKLKPTKGSLKNLNLKIRTLCPNPTNHRFYRLIPISIVSNRLQVWPNVLDSGTGAFLSSLCRFGGHRSRLLSPRGGPGYIRQVGFLGGPVYGAFHLSLSSSH